MLVLKHTSSGLWPGRRVRPDLSGGGPAIKGGRWRCGDLADPLSFAVLTWTARSASDSEARRAIVLALFIGDSLGFILALISQLAGTYNSLGWSTVAIYLLLAAGFGYFQFSKPAD